MGTRILVALLVGTMAPPLQSPTGLTHPGAIVDAGNGDPISDAQANAYSAEGADKGGVCPQGLGPIDARRSDQRGNFVFSIKRENSSYFAVYCANGFQGRPVPGNDNSRDGSRISPDPVRLYPTRARLLSLKLDPVFVAYSAISRVLDGAANDLKYFRASDPNGFAAAQALLDPNSREATQRLIERTTAPNRAGGAPGGQPSVATQAIAIVLDNASEDLHYFDTVPGGVMQLGLPKVSDLDRRTVTLLMSRPARFTRPV